MGEWEGGKVGTWEGFGEAGLTGDWSSSPRPIRNASAARGDVEWLVAGQPDKKSGSAIFGGLESDGAPVGLDDGFYDGGSEAGSAGFPESNEGLEEPITDVLRDATAIILDNDFDSVIFLSGDHRDPAPAFILKTVDGVGDEVLENADEFAFLGFDGEVHGLELELDIVLLKVGKIKVFETLEKFLRIDRGELKGLLTAGEVGDLIGHIDHAANLFLDIGADALGFLVLVGLHQDLRPEADEGKRIFKVVDDGVHHVSDDGHLLGLEHVLDVMPCGVVEVPDNALEDHVDGSGGVADEVEEGTLGNDPDRGFLNRNGGEGTGLPGKKTDLAEEFTRAGLADHRGAPVLQAFGEGDLTGKHQVEGVGGIAFLKNDLVGTKFADGGNTFQVIPFLGFEFFKKGMLGELHLFRCGFEGSGGGLPGIL